MNINITSVGYTMMFSAVITAVLAYILAKGKVEYRYLAGVFGFIGGLVQPIGFILLIVLWLKRPIPEAS